MKKKALTTRLHKSQARYSKVVVPALKEKVNIQATQIKELERQLQDIRDIARFGKIITRFPREYVAEIGSKGGKAGSANMTKAQRIARAKKARAAQLKKGGER